MGYTNGKLPELWDIQNGKLPELWDIQNGKVPELRDIQIYGKLPELWDIQNGKLPELRDIQNGKVPEFIIFKYFGLMEMLHVHQVGCPKGDKDIVEYKFVYDDILHCNTELFFKHWHCLFPFAIVRQTCLLLIPIYSNKTVSIYSNVISTF